MDGLGFDSVLAKVVLKPTLAVIHLKDEDLLYYLMPPPGVAPAVQYIPRFITTFTAISPNTAELQST